MGGSVQGTFGVHVAHFRGASTVTVHKASHGGQVGDGSMVGVLVTVDHAVGSGGGVEVGFAVTVCVGFGVAVSPQLFSASSASTSPVMAPAIRIAVRAARRQVTFPSPAFLP